MKTNLKNKNNKKNERNKLLAFSKYLFKYFSLLSFIIIIIKIHFPNVSGLDFDFDKKYIFTFWEPKKKIPGYLRLCIKTWEKFLTEYEIKIFDYRNAKNYIGESLFYKIACKEMSKSLQADAIRVALLQKFGGIWMDTDTIILNREFLKELNRSELIMFGENQNKTQSIAFIYAKKNSTIMNEWLEQIIKNVNIYRDFLLIKRNNSHSEYKILAKKMKEWNYLGNGIIDPLLRNVTNEKYYLRLDKFKMNAFPELLYFENVSIINSDKYKQFYFQKGEPKKLIHNDKGIIFLHNSWTPKIYKKMTEKKFLKKDILLSKLLAQILNIKI
jgi:hypothetical protein